MKKTIFLLVWSVVAWAQAPSSKITVTDMTQIKQVANLVVSPDQKKVVYELRSIESVEGASWEYDYKTHLYVLDVASGTTKPLTRGKVSASQAFFAPDGKSVYFVRSDQGKSTLYHMPLDGGEAQALFSSSKGLGSPKISPDGKQVLFSVSISFPELLKDSVLNPSKTVPSWSFEKPGFASNDFLQPQKGIKPNPDGSLAEIRAFLQKDVEDKKAKVINRLNFHGEATVEPDMRFSHLMIASLEENAKAKPLTTGFWSVGQANWSPDGKTIWAVTGKDQNEHPDREQESIVIRIDPVTGQKNTVVEESGKSFSQVSISPNGQWMAMVMNTPNLLSFGQLVIAKVDGTQRQVVDFDRVPGSLDWAPTSEVLYFTASSNGGIPLFRYTLKSKKVERLTDYETGISDFAQVGNGLVYAKTQVSNPSELYSNDWTFKAEKVLTSHNSTWLAGKKLSLPEKRTYKNSLGQSVEYWIMPPTERVVGQKYPLLLNMHGGPTAMWGPGEFSMWHEFQFFCAQGYGVVYANPRGSGGYGKTFQFANYRDWGTGPQEDVLAAASDAAKESWADPDRQVITGGSYAGYLTAWIVAHDHRFKAAFAQRGVYELTTFMGEANAWRLAPNYFGLPWEEDSVTKLKANSPYTFVDKIKTPLLIKHGENDLRTGVSQSEMMFRSMKYLGKEVEYVRMPGGTHELSRSGNVRQRIDRMLRIYEFFERYVGNSK